MKNDLLLNSDHQDKNMKRLGQNKMSQPLRIFAVLVELRRRLNQTFLSSSHPCQQGSGK